MDIARVRAPASHGLGLRHIQSKTTLLKRTLREVYSPLQRYPALVNERYIIVGLEGWSQILAKTVSSTTLNSNGLRAKPWCTPTEIGKGFVPPTAVLTIERNRGTILLCQLII